MTFRRRLIVAMIPLFALLVALGGTGIVLIYHLGNRIDKILRENYDSVIFMRDLNESVERIDSSFQFALAGRDEESSKQYETNWRLYDDALTKERHNITLPQERELVDNLTTLSDQYRRQGDVFFTRAGQPRDTLYFGEQIAPGLYDRFREIKAVSSKILRINQDNMEEANRQARRLAHSSLIGYGGGLAIGIALAVFLVASTIRTILYPIRAVTESVAAIGAGDLDQLVPVSSEDELGQLARAFNSMAHQLRDYRQSHKAQLTRAEDEPSHGQLLSRSRPRGRFAATRRTGQSDGTSYFWGCADRGGGWDVARLAAARSTATTADGCSAEPPRVPAGGIRQGGRAANWRGHPLLSTTHSSHPRCGWRDDRCGRVARGHHPFSLARRGEKQSRGHGES